MARISTYSVDSDVIGQDRWIGSDWQTQYKTTKNFTADGVAAYFNRSAIIDTGQFSWDFIPYNNTQPQPEKTFMKVDWITNTININNLSGVLRVSALTLGNQQPGTFIAAEWVGMNILVHVPNAPSAYAIYTVESLVPDGSWYYLMELSFVSGVSFTVLQNTPLVMGYFGGANLSEVYSVFGRTGDVVAEYGDYTTSLVPEGSNLYFTTVRSRESISTTATGLLYSSSTGILSLDTGYFIPTTTQEANWNLGYNNSIVSASVTGTSSKTLTLNQQDGGTITTVWSDYSPVDSVFGRTGAIVAVSGDYNTSQVTESTNLYFTDARSRSAISLTTTGTSGAATYSSSTGILNIPQYQGGVTSFNTRTGAITLTSGDVTGALGFTPYNATNPDGFITSAALAGYVPTTRTITVNGDTQALSANVSFTVAGGVTSFNTRTGAITLTSGDVTGALGYTPYNATNPDGFITSAALAGYVPTTRTITINGDTQTLSANVSFTIASGVTSFNTRTGAITLTSGDVTTALGFTPENAANKGIANGYASLDSSGTVPTSQLPAAVLGGLNYQGVWNATTNTPTLTQPQTGVDGYFYIVDVAGVQFGIDFEIGDWIVNGNDIWSKIDNTDKVASVFGRTGVVTAQSGDYTTSQVTEGTNLYYTDARSRASISLTTTGTSGVATYNTSTGAFNIPNYAAAGTGLPAGGTAGQILSKIDAVDYNSEWIDNYATQVKNDVKLGAALTIGTPVYVSGANGTNMIVSASSNTTEAGSSKTFGLLETGGALNDIVKCVTYGLIDGLDTSAANAAGDPVWLGPNGTLLYGLANKPYAPAHMVYIGVVTRKQSNNGEIFVNVQNGFELDELHNVSARTPSNNDILYYSTATSLWQTASIPTVLGYTPVDSTGSAGYVPKFTSADVIGNSIMYDNGTSIGINTTTELSTKFNIIADGSGDLIRFGRGVSDTDDRNLWINFTGDGFAISTNASKGGYGWITDNDSGYQGWYNNGFTTPQMKLNNSGQFVLPLYTSTSSFSGTAVGNLAFDSSGNIITTALASGSVTSVAALTLGTTGTDLSSTVANSTTTPVITLNVPTASATNRGALSSADWSTFNSKEPAITAGTTAQYFRGDKTFQTLNTSVVPEGSNLYYTNSRARLAISLTNTGTSGAATYDNSTGIFNIPNYQGQITLTTTGTSGPATFSSNVLNIPQYSVNPSARNENTFTATAGQTTFTITGGYTVGLVDVFVNGAKYAPADFTATNGTTVVLGVPLLVGDIVDIINYTSAIAVLPTSRDVIDYTATASQTTFTVSGGYTVGLLDVYVNGTKLTSSEVTATNGTTFVLTVASIVGDQVQAIRYNSSITGVSGSGTANYVPKFTATGTIGNSSIFDNGTQVGIGTASPNNYGSTTVTIASSTASNTAALVLRNSTSTVRGHYYSDGANSLMVLGSATAHPLTFVTGDTERMRITAAGNVGIGTSSPAYALQVSAASGTNVTPQINAVNTTLNGYGVLRLTGNSRGGFIDFYDNSTAQASIVGQGGAFYVYTNGDSSGTPKMTITSGGDLLLGATSKASTRMEFRIGGTSNGAAIILGKSGSSTVGFGVDTGYTPYWECYQTGVGVYVVNVTGGVVLNQGATSWSSASDINLKDISGNIDNALSKLYSLNGVNFTWKSDKDKVKQVGLIAQEVQEVLPEAVSIDRNNNLTVRYTEVIPLLVEAIKELSAKITLLENK